MRHFRKLSIKQKKDLARREPLVGGNEDGSEGLFELRGFDETSPTSPQGTRTMVEIVAIHGLNGHPFDTWKKDNVIWFSQFVPDFLPDFNLRISTFGYNSRDAFGDTTLQLEYFVSQLITELHLKRRNTNTSTVPIVFLCHSMGGYMFKKLLVMAHEKSSKYIDIAKSLKGVMFIGTPHASPEVDKWIPVVEDIANTCDLRTDRFSEGLEAKSNELIELLGQFNERSSDLKIVSVYEEKPADSPTPVVVGREFAALNVKQETLIPVDADHQETCRFSDQEDPRYRQIMHAFVGLVENAKAEEDAERKVCMQSLYFPYYEDRRSRVAPAAPNILTWIWNHAQCQEWVQDTSSSILWIQGKSRNGKSSLANHLRSEINSQISESDSTQNLVVDFCHTERTDEEHQGHIWMLRSILYQLLLQAPGLWEEFQESFRGYKQRQAWDLYSLQRIFASLGGSYNRGLPLTVYVIVDAMDVTGDSRRLETVNILHQVSMHGKESSVVFKMLVTSRPCSLSDHVLENCRYLKLDGKSADDITIYINRGVEEIAVDILQRQPQELNFMVVRLINHCRGDFLWVKLVLLELKEYIAAQKGVCSNEDIEKVLKGMPREVEVFYAKMILGMEQREQKAVKECQTLLRWIAYSPQPLTLGELWEVMAANTSRDSAMSEKSMHKHKLRSIADIKKRIASACGNLIEVRELQVQFIHPSARDYILSTMESRKFRMAPTQSQKEISSFVVEYLDFFNFTVLKVWKLPLSGVNWSHQDLSRFLQLFQLERILMSYCVLSYWPSVMQMTELGVGLLQIFKALLQRMRVTLRLMENAAIAALFYNEFELPWASTLDLQNFSVELSQANVSTKFHTGTAFKRGANDDTGHRMVLTMNKQLNTLSARHRAKIASSGQIPSEDEDPHYVMSKKVPNTIQRLGYTVNNSLVIRNALTDACQRGDIRAFNIFADYCNDWNFQDHAGRTLLHIAVEEGHEEIALRLLFRAGLNLTLKDKRDRTVLDIATAKKFADVVKALHREMRT
ncbi:ankyrin repeat protein [Phlyctema vagabunda]|uniref:Ankyrin repeat protein n=1 Tax=Phlyctema vagabunda TaxID=108571 RepID=A0ABR4PDB1_9HELO